MKISNYFLIAVGGAVLGAGDRCEPIQLLDEEIESSALHLFAVDEVQASRGWRSQRSGWFYRPDEDESTHIYRVWAGEAGPATLEVLDADGELLQRRAVEDGVAAGREDEAGDEDAEGEGQGQAGDVVAPRAGI